MSVEPVPRREMVTRSPRSAQRPVVPAPLPGLGETASRHGSERLRALIRSQLRSSILCFAALAVPTAALPLVLASDSLAGPALAWIVLGFAGYPPMVLLAWWYVRRAERHEHDYARLAGDD